MTSSVKGVTAQLGIGGAQAEVTDWFQQQLLAALSDPLFNIPKAFETWMVDRVAVAGLNIGIGQIIGFSQFAAQAAPAITTQESTSSTTYTDLATVGPRLTGLPDGQYVIFFGATANATGAGTAAWMSVSLNGATGSDSDGTRNDSDSIGIGLTRATIATLADSGDNSISVVYRSTTATSCVFSNRWLIALKFANA